MGPPLRSRVTIRLLRATAACVLLAGALAGPIGGAPAAGTSRYTIRTRKVARGLVWQHIVDSVGPNRINVLRVDPATALSMDVALSRNRLKGFQTTSSMAAHHNAIAAVNGDFGTVPGRPVHAFAEDGELKQTSLSGDTNFAISQSERSTYFGHPSMAITGQVASTGETWSIDRWNTGAPAVGQIAGYSAPGVGVVNPPANACSVRLLPSGPQSWASSKMGVVRPYRVGANVCAASAMTLGKGIVLSAQPGTDEAVLLQSLVKGATLRLTWSFGWGDILDALGGGPPLIQNGLIVAPTTCWSVAFCQPDSRTGVGVTSTGKVILATVDGLRPGYSVGMTPLQWAREFQRLGAVWALNLDGGGSTTMVIKGKVVNRPSDPTGQRAVSSALLVLPGADPGDKLGVVPRARGPVARRGHVRIGPRSPGLAPATRSAWHLALHDPSSTGGYLDALTQGVLGPAPVNPPLHIHRLARRFRRSQA